MHFDHKRQFTIMHRQDCVLSPASRICLPDSSISGAYVACDAIRKDDLKFERIYLYLCVFCTNILQFFFFFFDRLLCPPLCCRNLLVAKESTRNAVIRMFTITLYINSEKFPRFSKGFRNWEISRPGRSRIFQ